ncbi:MAG TPA: TetR/AcrR family transcriptional regulator [Anaerolineales bacterium]|nr:TetR/AcrR family transcriptional regulator [Anaerolineales bacterium]
MVRPTKKKQIANIDEAIKEAAWYQIAEKGASALSLRAIARELKITAPAIYNYFPDRDALVTALIVDAFTSFGDSQLEARDSVNENDHAGRVKAIGIAYRNWAHTYPQRYQLIFGTPIPNYQPQAEKIFPSSVRSIHALFSVVDRIRAAGKLNIGTYSDVNSDYKVQFTMWKENIGELHISTLSTAFLIWSRIHGIVSLEIQGNLPPFGDKGDDLYRAELELITNQFIKE